MQKNNVIIGPKNTLKICRHMLFDIFASLDNKLIQYYNSESISIIDGTTWYFYRNNVSYIKFCGLSIDTLYVIGKLTKELEQYLVPVCRRIIYVNSDK